MEIFVDLSNKNILYKLIFPFILPVLKTRVGFGLGLGFESESS